MTSKPQQFSVWLSFDVIQPSRAVVKFSTIFMGSATRLGPRVVHQTTVSLANAKWKRIRHAEDFAGNRNAVSDTFELIDRSIDWSIDLVGDNE